MQSRSRGNGKRKTTATVDPATMKVKELRAALSERGESTDGLKSALVARLQNLVAEDGTEKAPATKRRCKKSQQQKEEEEEEEEEEADFRGVAASTAASSLSSSSSTSSSTGLPPLLPRDYRHLLLDIEGCTTSIAFVHDELFPYARKQLATYTAGLSSAAREKHEAALRADVMDLGPEMEAKAFPSLKGDAESLSLEECVIGLMDHDIKAAGLKGLQGAIWKDGYDAGTLKGHVYADTVAAMRWCAEHGVACSIYSSGSVRAQKLLFGNSNAGDLLPLVHTHFDITTSGPKKEAASYRAIAASLGVPPSQIVFASDSEAELVAAEAAGIGCAVMTVRPGNAPLTPIADGFPRVESLLQLCGCD
jgi:enolase-phosphatase E1